jgi:hypothetical protein
VSLATLEAKYYSDQVAVSALLGGEVTPFLPHHLLRTAMRGIGQTSQTGVTGP